MDPSFSSTSPPAPPAPKERAFETWRQRAMQITGLGLTEDDRKQQLVEAQRTKCEQWRAHLMEYSPTVVFMMKHLRLSGCAVPSENIACTPCSGGRSGGFDPERGAIWLCQGMFSGKKHMEGTMVHELVHMYDHCKFKVDWHNLRHHACSEIRANSLSGDCRFSRELDRGVLAFSKQHQACVRRRAIISVRANPLCPDEASAERAVNEVWESCFSDTRPFDEIY